MNNAARDLGPFRKDLERLEKKVRNKIVRRALRAGAKVLAAEIRKRAPVGETGDLRRGVKVRSGKGRRGTITILVEVSTPEGNVHTGFVEFGTVRHPANPFIRRSVDSREDEILGKILEEIATELAGPG